MASKISMDDIYGCSLEEWLLEHKIVDIKCDIKLLRERLHFLTYRFEWLVDMELLTAVKEKLQEKEELLKRVKEWRRHDKAMQRERHQ